MASEGTENQISGSQEPASRPTYELMIKDAITTLKKRTGSSQYAIAKFMEGKYKHLPLCFRKILLYHLKRLVALEKLVKVKGSFKLPPKRKVATPKPKPMVEPQSKPKSKQALKADSPAEAKRKPRLAMINARPMNLRNLTAIPQTKPKPKPRQPLKAKETKTTLPAEGMPDPIAVAQSVLARNRAAWAKYQSRPPKDPSRTAVRTKPKEWAKPKKGRAKATPKGKAPAESKKPKSSKTAFKMRAMNALNMK